MNNEVIVAGLATDSVSSKVSLDSTLSFEASAFSSNDVEIPTRYYKDYLKVLPVNVQTVFVYWELTQDCLQTYDVSLPLVLKIFDEENGNELLRVGVTSDVGSTYLNAYWSEKKVVAEIGYLEEGDFKPVLSSNHLTMPSNQLHVESSSKWLEKASKIENIIKASMEEDTPSSSATIKQIENIFYDARLNTLSSFALVK